MFQKNCVFQRRIVPNNNCRKAVSYNTNMRPDKDDEIRLNSMILSALGTHITPSRDIILFLKT